MFLEILQKYKKKKIRLCCYPYWSLYDNDRERNALFKPLSAKRFKLRKTFMESQRVSDSFANITAKIRSIKSKLKAYQTHFKYAMIKVTNIWVPDIFRFMKKWANAVDIGVHNSV